MWYVWNMKNNFILNNSLHCLIIYYETSSLVWNLKTQRNKNIVFKVKFKVSEYLNSSIAKKGISKV